MTVSEDDGSLNKCMHQVFSYTCHAVLTVEFSSPDYSVPENEETVTVCLQTDTGNNKPVSVMIFTISKTATGSNLHKTDTRSNLQINFIFFVQLELIIVKAPRIFPYHPFLDHVQSALR